MSEIVLLYDKEIFCIFVIFWGGFRKMNIFLGMEILWICYWGHDEIGLYFRIISMHLGSFLKVKVQNWVYLFVLLKVQIFEGCWKFLILIFLG